MEQNIKDIEADSNATLTEIWPTQKANKDTRPFWFEQFGSSTLAYQSKRKRKRASQSFIWYSSLFLLFFYRSITGYYNMVFPAILAKLGLGATTGLAQGGGFGLGYGLTDRDWETM